jgi:ribonuclease Z
MDLDVLFLGTAGSAPSARRALPATLVRRGGDRLLIDCGEGTQRQLLQSTGLVDLEQVFVTHLHADHVLGLPGMIKSFSLRGREVPLTIYGPPGLKALFSALKPVIGKNTYRIDLEELAPNDELRRDDYVIATFEVRHRVPAYGYALIEDERPGRFDDERARELGVAPGPDYGRLQRGETVSGADGDVTPELVVGEARPGRKVVLSGDTAPCDMIRAVAHNADVLVHEATFLSDERERAAETGHTTARQAAEIAEESDVTLLALTHVSPRYGGGEVRREARAVFKNTIVPRDFDRVEVPFAERGEPTHIRAGDEPTAAVTAPG